MPLVYRARLRISTGAGKEAAVRAEEMRDIIISKLKDGPKTTPELVEMTGFSPEQIRERMRRAKVEGMVESAVIDKEFMWYDKKQWDHVVQVKEDKGPITFGELRRISHYIRPNFRIRVYDCVPKRGEETAGVIRMKHIDKIYRHVVTFKEGGSTTLVKLAQYFRDGSRNRCIK